MTNTEVKSITKPIAEMNYQELLEFVKGHPVFAKRLKQIDNEGREANYMIAMVKWNDEKGDISLPKKFFPFFNKYFSYTTYEPDDEFLGTTERHELDLIKAVVEYEISFNGKMPKVQTQWSLTFIENHLYSINYGYDYDFRIEIINDIIYEIPSEYKDVTETKSRNYAWQQSLEKGIKLCRENGHEGDAQTLEDIVASLTINQDL